MRYSIYNLGCKVNAYEAESIASVLNERNWQRVNFEEEADVVIIFTCAVTNTAAAKTRKMLHRIKRHFPNAITVMVGCYVQVDDGKLEDADILVGTAHKKDIPSYIDTFLKEHEKIKQISDLDHASFDGLSTDQFDDRARAFLKIEDGCNQFCSYCIIPFVRGRERSMAPDEVIHQLQQLSKQFREVVLTGIHTGRYGHEHGLTLVGLLKRILKEVPELERIRISSIEVTEINDELINLMKKEPRIARHLHIPIQSGTNTVLKRMHRPYTTEEYKAMVDHIRQEIPGISISCDLIVGFPGETDEEFEDTYQFLKDCAFSFLHVFPYSSREGTLAEKMDNHIKPNIKKERTKKCLSLSNALRDTFAESWVNQEADVLCETNENGFTLGYTSQYIPVKIVGKYPHGEVLHVKLTAYRDCQMYAEVI